MKKNILKRGYVTEALTDIDGNIYGFSDRSINFELSDRTYYWSEVYVEPGYMCTIIRKGMRLSNCSSDSLDNFLKQSKVNLSK